jgi:hypothetical protein
MEQQTERLFVRDPVGDQLSEGLRELHGGENPQAREQTPQNEFDEFDHIVEPVNATHQTILVGMPQ